MKLHAVVRSTEWTRDKLLGARGPCERERRCVELLLLFSYPRLVHSTATIAEVVSMGGFRKYVGALMGGQRRTDMIRQEMSHSRLKILASETTQTFLTQEINYCYVGGGGAELATNPKTKNPPRFINNIWFWLICSPAAASLLFCLKANQAIVVWHQPWMQPGERPERVEEAAEAVRRHQAHIRLCRTSQDGESAAGPGR